MATWSRNRICEYICSFLPIGRLIVRAGHHGRGTPSSRKASLRPKFANGLQRTQALSALSTIGSSATLSKRLVAGRPTARTAFRLTCSKRTLSARIVRPRWPRWTSWASTSRRARGSPIISTRRLKRARGKKRARRTIPLQLVPCLRYRASFFHSSYPCINNSRSDPRT